MFRGIQIFWISLAAWWNSKTFLTLMGDHPMKWNLLQFSKTLHKERKGKGRKIVEGNLSLANIKELCIFSTAASCGQRRLQKWQRSTTKKILMMYRYMWLGKSPWRKEKIEKERGVNRLAEGGCSVLFSFLFWPGILHSVTTYKKTRKMLDFLSIHLALLGFLFKIMSVN